jgi:integrase
MPATEDVFARVAEQADVDLHWQRVRERAGLKDARIHDLRHTFASVAAASGMSLLVTPERFHRL